MALTAQQCLHPEGDLEAAVLWPDELLATVLDTVDKFRLQGEAMAIAKGMVVGDARDNAVRHWVNYRAYRQKWKRLIGMPSTVSTSDEGSATVTQAQIGEWKTLMEGELLAWEAAISAPPVAVVSLLASESNPVTFEW